MSKEKKTVPANRDREDGRRQILLYMKDDLIMSLKKLAISEDTTAYLLAEEAVDALLRARRKAK
jgi:hypothetical protein